MLLFVSAGALEPPDSDPRMPPLMERSGVLPSGVLAACHARTQNRLIELSGKRTNRSTQEKKK